jgi:hypothetical protein
MQTKYDLGASGCIVIGDLASLASVRQPIVTDGLRPQTCPHQRTLSNLSLQPITRCEPKTSFD